MFATFENLMIPKCVLSIGNNEYCITLLKLISQYEANLQILAVSDGKQGIAYAQLERPDLILLDIAMPRIHGLDGLDVHRLLKCNFLWQSRLEYSNSITVAKRATNISIGIQSSDLFL